MTRFHVRITDHTPADDGSTSDPWGRAVHLTTVTSSSPGHAARTAALGVDRLGDMVMEVVDVVALYSEDRAEPFGYSCSVNADGSLWIAEVRPAA